MAIELTTQQQIDLDSLTSSPARMIDPRTKVTYVLIPEEIYGNVQEVLEDDLRQRAIRAVGLRNAARRINEES